MHQERKIIDRKTIVRLSELVGLGIRPEEAGNFAEDLSEIVNYADILRELDFTDIEPLLYVHDYFDHVRDDKILKFTGNAKILTSVAQFNEKEKLFTVPRVIPSLKGKNETLE